MVRIQSGGFQPAQRVAVAEEIVGASLHMLEPLLSQHPIEVELPPEQILVNCDGSLLERVFTNLLENATNTPAPRPPSAFAPARCPSGWSRSGITAPASPPISCSQFSTSFHAAIKSR